ncbi:Rrf2 family transcriptional regulator [Geobacter sp. SVR]|uniref:RrF2 family transcriptional regulator n=1 Tax=Geobacter sp. SVR TaxID=2495594 RepID=UPI00143EFFE0|nr:Rrf2 family transcriptional regulator [Geobacter sp. SVR]BCS54159.1 Rrf2 family transcriptional regulator [Geobacter sp. SVR]GCF85983.1 Rrf2 family transcriptional regulator [Geobacter sp. SVR]
MISRKTEYALKALTYLAKCHGRGPVLISDLATAENIPKKFLETILLALRKGNILKSRIGKGGGYQLAFSPGEITIGMVVRVLEGDFSPVQCLGKNGPGYLDECCDLESCGIKFVMLDVKSAISSVMDKTTLSDMIRRSQAAQLHRANTIDYSI